MLNISAKRPISDVWQGCEYAPAIMSVRYCKAVNFLGKNWKIENCFFDVFFKFKAFL